MNKDRIFSRPCPEFKAWLVLNSQGEIYPLVVPANGAWTGMDGKRNYVEALAGPVYGADEDHARAEIETDAHYEIAFNQAEKVKQNFVLFLYEPKAEPVAEIEYWSGLQRGRTPGTTDEEWEMKQAEKEAELPEDNKYKSIDFTNLS